MSDPGGRGTCGDSASTSHTASNPAELRDAWRCANDRTNGAVTTIDLLADISLSEPFAQDGVVFTGGSYGLIKPTGLYLLPGKKLKVRKADSVLAYRVKLGRARAGGTLDFRILFVDKAELTLEYVTIEGGRVSFSAANYGWAINRGGGGIVAHGPGKLALTGCLLRNNTAGGFGNSYVYGGAILGQGSAGNELTVEVQDTLAIGAQDSASRLLGGTLAKKDDVTVSVDATSTFSDFCWTSSGSRWEGAFTSSSGHDYDYVPSCITRTSGNTGNCASTSTTMFADVRTERALRNAWSCAGANGGNLVTIELSRDISLISSFQVRP